MPIEKSDIVELTERFDLRYRKIEDCDTTHADVDRKLHNDDKRFAVMEYKMNINNWLTLAIVGGVIALVIKAYLGG